MGAYISIVLFVVLWIYLKKRLGAQDKKIKELETVGAIQAKDMQRLVIGMRGPAPDQNGAQASDHPQRSDHRFWPTARHDAPKPDGFETVALPWSKAARDRLPDAEAGPAETIQAVTEITSGSEKLDEVVDESAPETRTDAEAAIDVPEDAEPATEERSDDQAAEMPEPLIEALKEVYQLEDTEQGAHDETPPADRAPSPTHSDLEQRLSTNWLVWIGGIALALAGIFLVRYIAEQGWLSPALRCAIGVLFGLALVFAGEVVRRRPLERAIAALRPDYVPQALTAGGLFSAFASVYLAYAFYGLIPSGWSFIVLAAITLMAFALSILQGRLVAILGLAGAVATPALVSTEDPSSWGFFSYLGLIVLATQGVADRKRWYWLPELSLLAMVGWTGLWVWQMYQNVDVLPIGVTIGIVAVGGVLLAVRAGDREFTGAESQILGWSIRPMEVGWTGLIAAVASALTLAVLSNFASSAHWLLLCFAIAAAVIARLLPRFGVVLPIVALVSVLAFGLIYLDETAIANLSERLLGWPAPTIYLAEIYEKFAFHAALIAVALFAGGMLALRRTSQPDVIALSTGAVPIALLLIGYAQFRNMSGDSVWVGAAIATVVAAALASQILRHMPSRWMSAEALYAALAVVAAFLALTFQFDRIWLTLSYASLVFALALVSLRTDYPILRQLLSVVVLVVLARLTINPDLRGYEIFHPMGMQWVTYGYLVPMALFIAASRILKRAQDDLSVTVLEGAALLLGVVFVTIEIRLFMTGSIYSGEYRLAEASLQTIAWLTGALILARRNLLYPRLFSKWGSRILTVVGGFQAIALQLILMNPVFSGEVIEGYSLFNILILSLLAPAILLWLIADSMALSRENSSDRGQIVIGVMRATSALLVFAFVTEEIRVFFQGMVIRPGHASLLELYVTTLAWLLPACLPILLLGKRSISQMRDVAFVAILAVAGFLVFGHGLSFNPAITGETVRGWPVLNTLLLGFVVPALLLYVVGTKVDSERRDPLIGGAYLLVFVWVWLMIKHAFQGQQLVVMHESLLELYITTLSWILLGALPFFVRRIADMPLASLASLAALAVSIAMLFIGHSVLFNPAVDQSFVPGWPVFNVLLLGFILPAVLLGLICQRLDKKFRTYFELASYVLLFVGVTMLVKHAFQGSVLTLRTLTDIEDYGYSAAWLVLALATMIVGIVRNNSHVRYASLAVLLLVVMKVFLLDMSGLAGLWRVASFFGLGISLVGIGYFYQRFMYARQTRGSATAPAGVKAQET